MLRKIAQQFRQPKGILGKVISKLMQKGNNTAYDTLLNKIDVQENEHLFEIGYGHGLGIEKILSLTKCTISGIDFSELMYKEATKRNTQHIANSNVNLFFGDFLYYDMPTDTFDKIFCINVIYFWDDLEKPFSKIRSGLKENGIFSFYMTHRDLLNKLKFTKDNVFNKYTIEHVEEKLKLCGFINIEYQYNNGYFICCWKN